MRVGLLGMPASEAGNEVCASVVPVGLRGGPKRAAPHMRRCPAGTPGRGAAQVEVAITMLYQLGEGAPEETLKPGSGALGQMAAGLMGADVPAGAHPLVAAALLETVIRYLRVLQQQPACLPRVLVRTLHSLHS